jgi:Dolichyl-phosphate-mannose-protein mannosyltransferase
MDNARLAWVRDDRGLRSVEVRPVPQNGAAWVEDPPRLADPHLPVRVDGSINTREPLTYVEAGAADHARNGVNGNGHRDGRHHRVLPVATTLGSEPLWMRLCDPAANGSQPVALPGVRAPGSQQSHATRLLDARASLRSAIACHGDLWVQLAVLFVVGFVSVTNMLHWPAALFDEGTYVGNAWAVQHRGTLAFYTYTYGHPPLGWLLIFVWTWASGMFGHATYSLDSARVLMFATSMVSYSLLYTLARRLELRKAFAAGAVILFALSPVSLFFHRGALLDNFATVWALAAFVLALSPQRVLWSFAGSGACFAASVLSKETTLVLLPALILAAFQNTDRRTRRYCLALFGSFLGLVGLAFPLYAVLKGELLPGPGHVSLIGTELDMLFGRRTTGNVLDPHSVAHGTVSFWLWLDPWLLGAALALSPIALLRRRTRAIALAFLIQVAMILRPGYLPSMYVIALLPFAALIVAACTQWLWCLAARREPIGLPGARFLKPAAAVIAAAALVAEATVVVLRVVPRWARSDRAAMTVRLDGAERAAKRWLIRNISHDKRLIVTDDFWLYLIEHGFDSRPVKGGFNSRTVVSYWPLDKDPAVRRYFPRRWHEFDYVVSTEAMRDTAIYTPTAAQALDHSRTVITFGSGSQRIEVRAIDKSPAAR